MTLSGAEKGEYGYRRKAKRDRLIVTILLFMSILVQLAIRSITSMSTFRVLFTLTAILTVIPMGVIASPLLASWKYHTPDISFYEEIHPYEEKFTVLYDLILTTTQQVIPLDAVVVHPIGVFGYCPEKKLDEKKAETDLDELFAASRLDPKIHIMKDLNNFERRLETLKPASDYEDDGLVTAEVTMLKSLCM